MATKETPVAPTEAAATTQVPDPYAAAVPNPYATVAPTNMLAIISLVTSLIGFHLAGIITGHIALRQIAQTHESGRGLALAGLIIGYAVFALAALGLLIWLIGAAILFFTTLATAGVSSYGY